MSGVGRVIVGTSGSPGSLHALRYRERLARAHGAVLMPVLAWDQLLMQAEGRGRTTLALGVGDNHARAAILDKASAAGFPVTTLVHASAIVAGSATRRGWSQTAR